MKLRTAANLMLSSLLCGLALGQPVADVDLGVRVQPETVVVPVHLAYAEDVFWVRFVIDPANADAGFLDIYSRFEVLAPVVLRLPRAGLYDAQTGRLVGMLEGGSHDTLFGSFGQTSPRRPWNIQCANPNDPEFCDWSACPFGGQWGGLPGGAYLLAIANDLVGFYDGFDVRVTVRPGQQQQRDLTLYLRVHPPETPYCDPDLNWDGNADMDDVTFLIHMIAWGDYDSCTPDPDYNRDGSIDQDDVLALIDVIAGGGCP
jgi:hypothetical protein